MEAKIGIFLLLAGLVLAEILYLMGANPWAVACLGLGSFMACINMSDKDKSRI